MRSTIFVYYSLDMGDANDFRITAVHELPDGEFSVELERGDVLEIAMLELVSRASSSDPYAYPAVNVLSCTDAAAREWLEADESAKAVWKACEFGVAA